MSYKPRDYSNLIGMKGFMDVFEHAYMLDYGLNKGDYIEASLTNVDWITGVGPIKSFTLRGIEDSPPYLHDGRLLTLEDTVEFFNIVTQLGLSSKEKDALVAFMGCL